MAHPIYNKQVVSRALNINAADIIKIKPTPVGNVQVVAKRRGSRFYKAVKFWKQFGTDRWESSVNITILNHPNGFLALNHVSCTSYVVSLDAHRLFRCQCPDSENQTQSGVPVVFCKHIAATLRALGFNTYNDYLQTLR